MTELNILLLIVSAGIALTGFAGKKVVDFDPNQPKPLRARVTLQGWVFLALIPVGLSLGIYKEVISFEGRAISVYPRFYSLVEEMTGYSPNEWTQYTSYRMSLRLLLQKAYRKVIGQNLPPSMERMLIELGQAGAIDDALCKRLDYLRWHTYSAEWGRLADGPPPVVLVELRADAEKTLRQLDTLIESVQPKSLTPNPRSICGQPPK